MSKLINLKKVRGFISNTRYYSNNPIYTQSDFTDLPVIDKHEVITHYADFSSFKDFNFVAKTSGSSGEILNVKWLGSDYYRSVSCLWKIRKIYGITPTDRYCTNHLHYKKNGHIIRSKLIIDNNKLSLAKCFTDDKSLDAYVNAIISFEVKWLMIQPSFLYSIAIYMQQKGVELPESVKLIELNGEYCSPELMKYFMKVFPKQRVVNMYGMQEFNGIAYADNAANKFSVINDNVIVEVLNSSNETCATGEEGHIVVTTLTNSVTPLIRYRTGDWGYIDENKALVITKSRSNDSLLINGNNYDGSIFWDFIDILNEDYCNYAIRQFQVEYIDEELIFTLVTSCNSVSEMIYQQHLETIIRERVGWSGIAVKVRLVDSIEVPVNKNKIKYFINHTI